MDGAIYFEGRNYLQYDRVKLAAYHSVSNKLGEFVAEWKAAFHGMNLMAIKEVVAESCKMLKRW